MLAIGLLAMALARPWLNNSQGIEAVPTNATARVILFDISQSMSAKRGASTAIDQAKSIALKYLDYSPNLQANLVLVGAKPRPVFPSLSPNLSILREAVQSSVTRSERTDIKSAMTVAGNMLSASPLEKTELIIISDFQRTNWSNLFLEAVPSNTKILLESVAKDQQLGLALRVKERIPDVGRLNLLLQLICGICENVCGEETDEVCGKSIDSGL
jgi:hypothetical protein